MPKHSDNNQPISTLVFDWGDTIMRNFLQFDGPMTDWPTVAAMPGITQALSDLKGKYRMVVATNATESDASQVKEALGRIGLDVFFDDVYTSFELNCRKPDICFFRALEKRLNESPAHLVLIGDDFCTDIIGADRAGWRSIWYNPNNQPCIAHCPIHDGEIDRLDTLPAVLDQLSYPDVGTCLNWMVEKNASGELLHTQIVAAIAYQLALWLRAAGRTVNPILAHRGGMLHDLAKFVARYSNETDIDHGELGAMILEVRQQYALAEIARRHVLLKLLDKQNFPQTDEEKVVYFADKLVEKGHIVKVEARLEALKKRYPHDEVKINQATQSLYLLQRELCDWMNIPEDDLVTQLMTAWSGMYAPVRNLGY
jgi:putative hydrolase of the HAD superfamily